MASSRLVTVEVISPFTVAVRTPGAGRLLAAAGVRRQYDRGRECWLTPRSTFDAMAEHCRRIRRPVVFVGAQDVLL